jgi:hypothetical protein
LTTFAYGAANVLKFLAAAIPKKLKSKWKRASLVLAS